jgi:hypothetical protein
VDAHGDVVEQLRAQAGGKAAPSLSVSRKQSRRNSAANLLVNVPTQHHQASPSTRHGSSRNNVAQQGSSPRHSSSPQHSSSRNNVAQHARSVNRTQTPPPKRTFISTPTSRNYDGSSAQSQQQQQQQLLRNAELSPSQQYQQQQLLRNAELSPSQQNVLELHQLAEHYHASQEKAASPHSSQYDYPTSSRQHRQKRQSAPNSSMTSFTIGADNEEEEASGDASSKGASTFAL